MVIKKNLIKNSLNRRRFIKIIGLSLFGSGSYGIYNSLNKNKIQKTYWSGVVLNNPVKLEIHSIDKKNTTKIIKEVEKIIFEADNIFNLQNQKSEIVRLNKEKSIKNPSSSLRQVIEKSQIISLKTEGAFDITVQPLWNFYYNHFINKGLSTDPDSNELKVIMSSINWKNVKLKNNQVVLENNASITLNGIAQGWITDKITDVLRNNNISNTLVDFGETYALGNYNNERPWNIMLRGPNEINKIISIKDKAVATSSGYGTMFEPTAKYHHIFNPKTGKSGNNYKAVSIVSNKAWISDSLSTSALLIDEAKIKSICQEFSANAFIVKNNNFEELT